MPIVSSTISAATGAAAPVAGLTVAPITPLGWFVNHYKMTEGDTSSYMLASHSFAEIPPRYRPGNIIELVGVKIPKKEIERVLKNEIMPAGVRAVTEDGENSIFWLHPMACKPPPALRGLPQRDKDTQRDNAMAFGDISKLLRKYPAIRGHAIVSSSVRTVLLYEADGRTLDTPYELKLHLPVFINGLNRSVTEDDTARIWTRQNTRAETAVPLYWAAFFGDSFTASDGFAEVGAKPPRTVPYSFGYIVRDAGFKIEDGRVHFQVPYFAMLGGNRKGEAVLLARLFGNLKKRNPELKPHDFVVDSLIAPYASKILDELNGRGILENGFHYQNPVLKISAPLDALKAEEPFSWADNPDTVIEGAATKEVGTYKLNSLAFPSAEGLIEKLVSNLWYYFSTEMNWAAAFPNFDRHAFRERIIAFLEQHSPADEAPADIDERIWKKYREHFGRIVSGLKAGTAALENEVMPFAESKPYGMAFNFLHGSVLFVTAPAGMETESAGAFTLMYDKLAYMTVAYPDADIHELVAHENNLYDTAKKRAAGGGVTLETDPVSFLGYVLNEVYSPPEIARLRDATKTHAGLANFARTDREWLSDQIFDSANGLFQRQLEAYRKLNDRRKKDVDLKHLPRAGYWFQPIVEMMLMARDRGGASQEIGAKLAVDRQYVKRMSLLKTYDRGPFLKWLAGAVFGTTANPS